MNVPTELVSFRRPDQNSLFKYLSKSYKKKKVFLNVKAKLVTQNLLTQNQQQKNFNSSASAQKLQQFSMKYKRIQLPSRVIFTEDQNKNNSYRNYSTQKQPTQTMFTKFSQKYQRTYQDANVGLPLNSKIYSKNSTMPTNLLKGYTSTTTNKNKNQYKSSNPSYPDIANFKLKSQVVLSSSQQCQQFNHEKSDFSILELQEKYQPKLFIKRRAPTSQNNRNTTQVHLRQFMQRRKVRTAQINSTQPILIKNNRKFITQTKAHEIDSLQSQSESKSSIKLNRYKQFTKTFSGWKFKK